MSICFFIKLTYYLLKKSSLQTCNYAKGRNQRRNNANDRFGKGFDVLKDHMLNRLMTGRCPPYITAVMAEVPLTRFFSKIASIFKKVLHLRHLNHLYFKPENGAFSKIKNRQTDRQTDKVTTVTLSAHAR